MVTARFLYGKEFEFMPQFKMWVNTNYKPKISGTDEGIWRRIRIIPFDAHIPIDQIDYHLKDKLIQPNELSGVFNWALEGYRMYKENGLKTINLISEQTLEYRKNMDIIGTFIAECIDKKPGALLDISQIYSAYCSWCDQQGERCRVQREVANELKKVLEFNYSGNRLQFKNVALTVEAIKSRFTKPLSYTSNKGVI